MKSLTWRSVFTALILLTAVLAGACGDDEPDPGSASSAITFEGEAEPLPGFSFDTGLIPAASPVQVSLKLAAGGKVKVVAAATGGPAGIRPKPGSGSLSLDVHVTASGRLKIDTPVKHADEALPGLKDINVPIMGNVTFDPFLLEPGKNAEATAVIPETVLPAIPLGSVPGKLQLTITKESTLRSSFVGGCLSVAHGQASYRGDVTTSGTLILKGTIVVDLPAPLNKSVDLGVISVPIPASKSLLDLGTHPALGAPDASEGGACESNGGTSSDGGSDSGMNSGGLDSGPMDGGAFDSGVDGASPTAKTYKGTLLKTSPAVPFGGSGFCNYEMELDDITGTVTILNGDSVINASVTDRYVERIVGTCGQPAAAPTNQTFTRSTATPVGSKLTLYGAAGNQPATSLSVDLVARAGGYDATMHWQRTDLGAPFAWSVTAVLRLVPE